MTATATLPVLRTILVRVLEDTNLRVLPGAFVRMHRGDTFCTDWKHAQEWVDMGQVEVIEP